MLRKKRKVIVSVIATALVFSQLSFGINVAGANSDVQADLYTVSEESGDTVYTLDNGEQLIETTDENGDVYYITKDTSGELDQRIYKDSDGEVMYEDYQTGETGVALTLEQEPVEGIGEQNLTTMNDGFTYVRTIQNSLALEVATASAIAGAIALVTPFAVSVLIYLGSTYAAFNAPSAYWYEVVSNRYQGTSGVTVRTQYIFHQYSDYNSYIGTETHFQQYTGGPR